MRKILPLIAVFVCFNAFAVERQESLKSIGISFGATFPASRAYPKKDAMYSMGLSYIWDIDVAFIEARLDHSDRFSGSPTQRYTAVTVGGNYIFLDQDIWAAFGGLNVGLGFTKVEGIDAKGGFHMGADVGALFLRQADVNLDVRMRVSYNTADLGNSHPFFFGLLAGIHF